MKTSVVVPTWNRVDSMVACLDGLATQTRLPDEVVVVDNASDDGTGAVIAQSVNAGRWPMPVRVVRRDVNIGPAAARNDGLAAAVGEVVAFTDSDCVPAPGWLAAGLAALAAPDVAIVQGRTLPDPDVAESPWSHSQRIEALSGIFETCNLFVVGERLRAAGGFPEDVGYFGEDTIAGWRVLRGGGRAAFAADAIVHHEVSDPGYQWFLRRTRHYRNWPRVVRELPELRHELLYRRFFLSRRHFDVVTAAAGFAVAAVSRRPWALALAIPFIRRHAPRSLGRTALRAATKTALFDVAATAACAEGSIRHHTLVL